MYKVLHAQDVTTRRLISVCCNRALLRVHGTITLKYKVVRDRSRRRVRGSHTLFTYSDPGIAYATSYASTIKHEQRNSCIHC
jgi:hypothetical protein